jgi:hypothetical protein
MATATQPAASATTSTTWPQWGTPISGQAPDATLAHGIGSIFKAGSRAEQLAAETENFPLKLVWFGTAAQAEAYAKQAYPKAFANWQAAQKQSIPQQLQQNTGLAGIGEIGAVLKAFLTDITDLAFWRSLGWLILGLVLLGAGLSIWLKIPQTAGRAAAAVT